MILALTSFVQTGEAGCVGHREVVGRHHDPVDESLDTTGRAAVGHQDQWKPESIQILILCVVIDRINYVLVGWLDIFPGTHFDLGCG